MASSLTLYTVSTSMNCCFYNTCAMYALTVACTPNSRVSRCRCRKFTCLLTRCRAVNLTYISCLQLVHYAQSSFVLSKARPCASDAMLTRSALMLLRNAGSGSLRSSSSSSSSSGAQQQQQRVSDDVQHIFSVYGARIEGSGGPVDYIKSIMISEKMQPHRPRVSVLQSCCNLVKLRHCTVASVSSSSVLSSSRAACVALQSTAAVACAGDHCCCHAQQCAVFAS
jgi:hypothetical protein